MNTHKWTDSQLRALEKKIKNAFAVSYAKGKAELLKAKAEIDEKAKTAEDRVLLWQTKKRLDELAQKMVDEITGGTVIALGLLKAVSADVFETVYNETAEPLELRTLTFKGAKRAIAGVENPFNEISVEGLKDKSVLERKIKGALLTSVFMNDSTNGFARKTKHIFESAMKDTIRLTRTQITQVENGARQLVGIAGKESGKTVYKRWVSQSDEKVRAAHLDANGQEVPIDEPFVVDGEELMYPGDTSLGASAGNVINCRCYTEIFTK